MFFITLLKNIKIRRVSISIFISTQNLNDFVKIFAESVLEKIEGGVEKTIKKLAAFFKGFRPALTYDALSGLPELTVKIEPETVSQSLQEIFAYLEQSDKRCYIAIDEFQQISEYQEKGTEALLRSYIQFANAHFQKNNY